MFFKNPVFIFWTYCLYIFIDKNLANFLLRALVQKQTRSLEKATPNLLVLTRCLLVFRYLSNMNVLKSCLIEPKNFMSLHLLFLKLLFFLYLLKMFRFLMLLTSLNLGGFNTQLPLGWFLVQLALALIFTVFLLIAVAYYTLAERKVMGSIHRRLGPNVVGP